ncbi:hypothetical protein Amsp01_051940 [Amycolatopsis sp. NBRC 101858]|nr:hypothetical protein Amsp01_051940 [Amycolatopsis sp. NBRC 101858]
MSTTGTRSRIGGRRTSRTAPAPAGGRWASTTPRDHRAPQLATNPSGAPAPAGGRRASTATQPATSPSATPAPIGGTR